MRSIIKNFRWVMTMVCLATACSLSTVAVFAQETDGAATPELVSLPKAVWPASASNYFGNTVTVNVDVNEKGRVKSVLSVSGPELACPGANSPDIIKLREAAQAVAMKAKFKPATIAGKAVASTASIEVVFPDVRLFQVSNPGSRVNRGDVIVGNSNPNVKTIQGELADSPGDVPMREAPKGEVEGVTAGRVGDRDAVSLPAAMPNTVSGGVLNGKAMSLSKPTYPPAAKAVRAAGSVNVQVLIGEDGSMLSANAVSGHPLLRSASRIAACSSKFSPTLLMGNPVKVSGIITYNFVP